MLVFSLDFFLLRKGNKFGNTPKLHILKIVFMKKVTNPKKYIYFLTVKSNLPLITQNYIA